MARHTSLWPPVMTVGTAAPPVSSTAMVGAIVVVVGALYVGSDILIPLALAILLSFMLRPVVIRLQRFGLGRIPAVLAVVLLLFVALLGLGAIVANQVVNLADNLPRYEWNLRAKIRDLRTAIPSGGVVERTSDMLRDLGEELGKATTPTEGETKSEGAAAAPEPVPVRIQQPRGIAPADAARGGRTAGRADRDGGPGGGLRDLHAAPARGPA